MHALTSIINESCHFSPPLLNQKNFSSRDHTRVPAMRSPKHWQYCWHELTFGNRPISSPSYPYRMLSTFKTTISQPGHICFTCDICDKIRQQRIRLYELITYNRTLLTFFFLLCPLFLRTFKSERQKTG